MIFLAWDYDYNFQSDLSDDNAVDGLDIQYFVDCVLGGGTNCRCGDFVSNGVVDLGDLPGFIAALVP